MTRISVMKEDIDSLKAEKGVFYIETEDMQVGDEVTFIYLRIFTWRVKVTKVYPDRFGWERINA